MNYCRQDVIINTEIKDDKMIIEKCTPIWDFANKHGACFNIGLDIQLIKKYMIWINRGNILVRYVASSPILN